MNSLNSIARDLGVAARIGWRTARRRLHRGSAPPEIDLKSTLEPWLQSLRPGLVESHRFIEIPANQPPWTDTGLRVAAGQAVTWFATGRVHLSRALDIYVEPSFQLWGRVGASGPVFRGTRDTHTFAAAQDGALWLASYFPGEWASRDGTLATPASEYKNVTGSMQVCVVTWCAGVDVASALDSQESPDLPACVQAERTRLSATLPAVAGWDYLWYLGPGEIYRPSLTPAGAPAIRCHTHGDVGILRRDAALPLVPGTWLSWSWRVDALPTDLREDSLPSHDYVSIAVEFDDGQDLTYYWSSALAVGTVYRCPLPTWRDKETHVVVRSGHKSLGQWLDERRDLHSDYRAFIGGQARSVVRVWLIANSLFQRGHGRCEYARIMLQAADGQTVTVL